MSRMENGPESIQKGPESIVKKENNPTRKIFNNIAEHYHGAVKDFLAEPHEYGLPLKVIGDKKAREVKDAFIKLGYEARFGEHRDYKEKKAKIYNISVSAPDSLLAELKEEAIKIEEKEIKNEEMKKWRKEKMAAEKKDAEDENMMK